MRAPDESEGGKRPGVKKLPLWLRGSFRDRFVRHIMDLVCSSERPWTNPSLELLQRELNRTYPNHLIKLHSDDAAVLPVSLSHCNVNARLLTQLQTLRELGVLRNQIGNEGLNAVIEYLPVRFTKQMLGSKDMRAKYIATVLADPQRPFIWEYFRPGTIPLAGDRGYYNEVMQIIWLAWSGSY